MNALQAAIESLIAQRLIWLQPGFLSPAACQQLLAELAQVESSAAEFENYGPVSELPSRKTRLLQEPEACKQLFKQRLEHFAPALVRHFGIQPQRLEQPQFLLYLPGDYFRAHRDWAEAEIYRERCLSLIVFLNDHQTEPGFEGGRLSFLLPHALDPERLQGVPIPPRAGTLLAFRPQLLHEVSPVSSGQRYTIAAWLA